MNRGILLLLLCLCSKGLLLGQHVIENNWQAQPHARQITDEQGLPSMEVYHIYEDQNGYLWIGSNDGLCRYDGKEFKRFTAPNLSSKSITNILSTQDGRMFCHNFTGQIFEVGKGSLQELKEYQNYITRGFAVIETTKDNQLWAGSDHGIYKYHPNMNQWKRLEFPGYNLSKSNSFIWWIQQDSLGRYWVINSFGELWTSDNAKDWEQIPLLKRTTNGWSANTLTANTRVTLHQGRYYLFNRLNKKVFLLETDTFKEINDLSSALGVNSNVTGIWPIAPDTILVSSYTGFYWLNGKYELKQNNPFYPDLAISTILKDREGNIWLGTLGSGIWMIPDLSKRTILPTQNIGRRVAQISLNAAEQKLYAALQNGWIGEIDLPSKTLKRSIIHPVKRNIAALHYSEPLNYLFVGIDCLYVLNPNDGKLIKTQNITCNKKILQGPPGYLLVANCLSLQAIPIQDYTTHRSKKTWAKYLLPELNNYLNFNRDRCRTAVYDSKRNTIYAAYQQGLFVHLPDTSFELKSRQNKPVYALSLFLKNDTLWAGSVSDGLYAFHKNKEVLNFNEKNGLKSNTITSLYCTDSVWIGSYEGIQCFHPITKKIYSWDKGDGVPSDEVNDIMVIDDQVWAATGNGIVNFPVNAASINYTQPQVIISDLIVNDKSIGIKSNTQLSHLENNLIIKVDGLNHRGWGNTRLMYRLLGLDTNWQISPPGNSELRFLGLPAKKYTLEAKAMNEDGILSAEPAKLSFTIIPPFWETWWFMVVILLSVILLIFLFVKNYLARIKAKNLLALERTRLKHEKNKAQTELRISRLAAIKAQMNPHFIFNALNAIQNFFITDDKIKANEYLGKFSDLMRKILEMSNNEYITLQEEIEALELYLELEKLRFGDKFSYTIELKLVEDADQLKLPSMLVQPYVENALKHGLLHKKGDKELHIRFMQSNDSLEVQIEDNGVGRKRAQEIQQDRKKYQSFATKANENRLDLLNTGRPEQISVAITDKEDEFGSAIGTYVVLHIPLQVLIV